MERICEFCAALRPIVFCKADSAFLCLSCDAKVHSANALSNLHFRCLVCESCRQQPARIRCLDHRMLLCRSCDATLHRNIANLDQHQRRMVGSFTGSPSAKQFAILWGFEANQLALQEQITGPSTSSISAASVVSTDLSSGPRHAEQNKMSGKGEQESSLVMQQILDLNRLQLNENNNPSSSVIRERGQAHSSSSSVYDNTMGRIDERVEDAIMRESSGPTDEMKALKESHFLPSPLSQSEYLSSYTSAAENSLVGEPFWHSRTSLESNQFWPQNMEEPRVCEELDGFDDLKMPEVDMTFPNFEELLQGDEDLSRALLEDESNALFRSEMDAQSAHATGNMVPSFMPMDQTHNEEKHTPHQESQKLKSFESATTMRPSYSYSYSFSHLSAETSGDDCHDSGHSGHPSQLEGPNIQGNGIAFSGRFKDKKKSRFNTKQSQLSPRKNKAEPNKRLKKPEDVKSRGTKATRSC